MRNVKFKYIPKEQCEIVGTEIEAMSTKTIKGTMKIHAIAKVQIPFIFVRVVIVNYASREGSGIVDQ